MSTDIHVFVQVLTDSGPIFAPAPKGLDGWMNQPLKWDLDCDGYAVYGPLGGVRMFWDQDVPHSTLWRRGLPGATRWAWDHGKHHNQIDLPDVEGMWWGDHSHTYYTVAEMMADPVWDVVVSVDGGAPKAIREWCPMFWSVVVPALLLLGAPDKVRMLVSYDN